MCLIKLLVLFSTKVATEKHTWSSQPMAGRSWGAPCRPCNFFGVRGDQGELHQCGFSSTISMILTLESQLNYFMF